MRSQTSVLALAATATLFTPALSSALPYQTRSEQQIFSRASHPASVPKTIYQYPNPTWIENIFARSNGDLLVSIIGAPELRSIHPFTDPPSESLVHSFTGNTAVFGITELTPDTFAVIAGNYSYTDGATLYSSSIWTVEFCDNKSGDEKKGETKVKKVTDVKEAQVLNGLTALNEHAVLAADSFAGTVVKVDIKTGKSEVVIKDKTMNPVPGSAVPIGINGVKIVGGYLYFTNTFQKSLIRVSVDPETGKATGPYEKLADVPMPDDLAVLDDGTAYVPEAWANTVVRVLTDGETSTHAGNLNSSVVAGGTSATFGRTYRDRGVAYISTQGGLGGPVNGTFTEGGKVVALSL